MKLMNIFKRRIGYAVGVVRTALLAMSFMTAGIGHAAPINYLVASFVPGSATISSSYVTNPAWFITNSSCPNIPNGFYPIWVADGQITQPLPVTATASSGSENIRIVLSITTDQPPVGAPVHYYGVNEPVTLTSPSKSYYFAGVPSSINIRSVTSGTVSTLTSGGATLILAGSVDPTTNAFVLPSLLLPDGVALIQFPSAPIALASHFFSGGWWNPAGVGISNASCGSPTGTFFYYQVSPVVATTNATVTTAIMSTQAGSSGGGGSISLNCVNGNIGGCNYAGTLTPGGTTSSVTVSSTGTGGIGYKIINSGTTFTGQIAYVMGY